MSLRVSLLLPVTMMIGLGSASTVAAQQLPEGVTINVIRLNDDVVCIDCPPGTQPEEWATIITQRISDTCTRVDTYHAPCPQGCQWTFVGSEYSGSCSGPEPSIPEVVDCPECAEIENAWMRVWIGGTCYSLRGYIVCDAVCYMVVESATYCAFEITSQQPARDLPGGVHRESAAPSFALSSRNPTSAPVVFRMGVPEASRGAHEDLVLFDLVGRRVRTLFSGVATPGSREHTWDLRTEEGLRARPGLYYARYRLGNEVRKQTVVIVR